MRPTEICTGCRDARKHVCHSCSTARTNDHHLNKAQLQVLNTEVDLTSMMILPALAPSIVMSKKTRGFPMFGDAPAMRRKTLHSPTTRQMRAASLFIWLRAPVTWTLPGANQVPVLLNGSRMGQ